MTNVITSPAVTVIYRGTLEDTAILVGLVHARANVGLIAFTGDLTKELKKYCEFLSRWLFARGFPRIAIHPTMTGHQLEYVLNCPLKDWGWGLEECVAALHLADLPLPPTPHAA